MRNLKDKEFVFQIDAKYHDVMSASEDRKRRGVTFFSRLIVLRPTLFLRISFRVTKTIAIGHVRCNNIHTWLRGLMVKLECYFVQDAPLRLETQKKTERRPHPHEDDENAHRKRINSKTLSKVDKFENAVYVSSCGRP